MGKARTVIATVPGMISEPDWEPLARVSEVVYHEADSIDEAELAALCDGFDYLMLNYDVVKKLSEAFYEAEPVRSLQAISADITGMDWASPAAASANGVVLLNIPHYSTESVAESILTEVLLHARQRHLAYVDELRDRDVEARKGINLKGRVGAVLGLGSIGSRTAELLAAVGMDVLLWNRSERDGVQISSLDAIFEQADVICLSVKTVKEGPEANVEFVNRELLERCEGTIIVNLANKALVDHDALVDAIQAGKVSGYSVERTPELLDSPLGGLEQVHFPPSNAWYSDESLDTLRQTWVSNVVAAIGGELVNQYRD